MGRIRKCKLNDILKKNYLCKFITEDNVNFGFVTGSFLFNVHICIGKSFYPGNSLNRNSYSYANATIVQESEYVEYEYRKKLFQ